MNFGMFCHWKTCRPPRSFPPSEPCQARACPQPLRFCHHCRKLIARGDCGEQKLTAGRESPVIRYKWQKKYFKQWEYTRWLWSIFLSIKEDRFVSPIDPFKFKWVAAHIICDMYYDRIFMPELHLILLFKCNNWYCCFQIRYDACVMEHFNEQKTRSNWLEANVSLYFAKWRISKFSVFKLSPVKHDYVGRQCVHWGR